ncbi:MAG: hypothetical protein J7M25_05140 [Deltaproteobacteria bacterium]|nr:hypothetical protein [Deltaproteobacteria bacterium]
MNLDGKQGNMQATVAMNMVLDRLRAQFGRVWLHPKGTRAFGKLDVPVHKVAVHGWYPDMLCLTDDDRIIAVILELQDADLMRGLGRAVAVRSGVHATLLAADRAPLERIADTVLRAGVGLCHIGPGADVAVTMPPRSHVTSGSLPQHNDILRELEMLSNRSIRRRFPVLTFDHPLHFLAPVLAIRPGQPQVKKEVAGLLLERWEFDGPRIESWWNSLYGSLLLGLVDEQDGGERLVLTERGQYVRTALLARYSAGELKAMTGKNPILMEQSPNVAFLLRSLYMAEPDAAVILSCILSTPGRPLTMQGLMALMIQRHPNVALNVLVRPDVQNRFAEAWRQGRLAEMLHPRELGAMVHPAVVGYFKRQLVHLGFLHPNSPIWFDEEGYDPERDLWGRRF